MNMNVPWYYEYDCIIFRALLTRCNQMPDLRRLELEQNIRLHYNLADDEPLEQQLLEEAVNMSVR